MIFVKKPPVDSQAWQDFLAANPPIGAVWTDLVEKAGAARERLIKDFDDDKAISVNDTLYKRYMDFLLRLFNGKCAYCEAKITLSQPGDVEHFRPKGRIVDENFKPIQVKHPRKPGTTINHPGYYWLAYEWMNLLPSCIDCNRYRKHGAVNEPVVNKTDEGAGKADRFPLKDETSRAVEPDREIDELTLLINPSEVDPGEHFEFLSNGLIKPKTAEGEASLKVFGLNMREDLQEARANAFDDADAIFERYMDAIKSKDSVRKNRSAKRINSMLQTREAYSAMHLLAIYAAVQHWKDNGIPIKLPLPEPV